jgi:hypothetical protein
LGVQVVDYKRIASGKIYSKTYDMSTGIVTMT